MMRSAQALQCTDAAAADLHRAPSILGLVNKNNMGQMIGLLLIVIAAAFGGYVLGSADAETATEVRTEERAEPTTQESSEETSENSADENSAAENSAETFESQSGLPLIFIDELPDEAIDTLILIDDNGPYPYDKDGSTFQNREGLLPDYDIGYYREFTVDTPGLDHRGARRIVGGSGGELYYADTHYESFSEIADW